MTKKRLTSVVLRGTGRTYFV